jgi:hypothetical protein
MDIITDKKARNKIEQLEEEISTLRLLISYYDPNKRTVLFGSKYRVLKADDILRRFEEIYKILEVERVPVPTHEVVAKLVKKSEKEGSKADSQTIPNVSGHLPPPCGG